MPINNPGELTSDAGCRYSMDRNAGTLTISEQAYAETSASNFGVSSDGKKPFTKVLRLYEFDDTELEGDWPFRGLVACFMFLANQARPDIEISVRAVARYTNSRRELH